MFVAAVTGTNGKTSTVEFARQLFDHAGRPAASLGTLGLTTPRWREPDPFVGFGESALPRLVDRLRHDAEVLAVEAFSSSIEGGSFDALDLDAAGFTNLSRDHLSHHDSVEDYFAAKRRLFDTVLPSDGTAVVGIDGEWGSKLRSVCRERGVEVVSYGRDPAADLRLGGTTPTDDGTRAAVALPGERTERELDLPLVGDVMVRNALCALGLALAGGVDAEAALDALGHLDHPEGRLDRVAVHDGAEAYVDYAHTPAALAAVLDALRPRADGRLVVVFGCGGDRDAGKRRRMGAVVGERADVAVVTDDNPRDEDPAAIRSQVLDGCPDAVEVPGRRAAIERGVATLEAGDVLVVAGKGHERHQVVDGEEIPFSDAEVVAEAMADGG